MKKIVFLSLFALCLPWTLVAQSIDDDLYYTPSKNKEEKKEEVKQEKKVRETPAMWTNITAVMTPATMIS